MKRAAEFTDVQQEIIRQQTLLAAVGVQLHNRSGGFPKRHMCLYCPAWMLQLGCVHQSAINTC
jgi:hypothetical protein